MRPPPSAIGHANDRGERRSSPNAGRAVRGGRERDQGGHAAENMPTLRRLALNPVKGEKALKIGVAAKRKRAGRDLERLRAILRLAQ